MGSASSAPERPAVSAGKIRICVTGFGVSHNVGMAQKVAKKIYELHSDQYEAFFCFNTFDFKNYLENLKKEEGWDEASFEKPPKPGGGSTSFQKHGSAPFVWLEYPDGKKEFVGGRDYFCDWASKKFAGEQEIVDLAGGDNPWAEPSMGDLFFENGNVLLSGTPQPAA
mmetsp:Transcript_6608/g.13313  ORF Transcript_6608/g.13313 Transcript_6608/m.13313 type:complete len:168 (+) Transcript_6608:1-504(+)